MRVPLLDLKAQLAPLREEILEAVTEVVDSTCYIMGPHIERFEEHVAAYCGTRFALGVSSGTDALLIALTALGIGPGDLVITTPFTFFATMGSILRLGARPLFADIDPVTYNLDPARMEELLARPDLSGRVKAVLPVHLYGQCADMGRIGALAERYRLPVIEDAAQAIGAAHPRPGAGGAMWRRAGSMGLAGCFSFFPSKNLGGIGDGGMVVTDDERLIQKLRILRVHGSEPKYYHKLVGGNFRLDALQAAVLDRKLSHLPAWHKARRRNAEFYDRLFADSGLVAAGKIVLPAAVYRDEATREKIEPDYHIYNQYVIRAADRDRLRAFLTRHGIGTEIYYPVPLHRQECVAGLGYEGLSLPRAEKAAAETLALPIYPELTDAMQHEVVDRIVAFYREASS
ncbi:MAG: DegT/DnrJ/EryC1/StrS family aminotransferase [Desulfobacteraceae bacterium]|nr:DegT/DnrJ/EryC1/StrS family aminotransferase [Desulfobacteraceae bacterium]